MTAPHPDLNLVVWPAHRLAEAIEFAALRCGLIGAVPHAAAELPGGADPAIWIDAVAARLGIEVEPLRVTLTDLDAVLRSAAPALLRLPVTGEPSAAAGFLLLLRGGRRRVTLLSSDLRERQLRADTVRDLLSLPALGPWQSATDRLLDRIGSDRQQRSRVRSRFLAEYLQGFVCSDGWLLRATPAASTTRLLRLGGALPSALLFPAAYIVLLLLQLAAWSLLGRGILSSDNAALWSSLWAMLLLTMIPFQLLVGWSQGYLAVSVGAVLKQRLLFGALQLQPDDLRLQGMGQFLGRVMEADVVESLALQSALLVLIAAAQLVTALLVLTQGALALLHSALLIAVILLVLWLARQMLQSGRHAAEAYRTMTNNLVERMIGHRTRLAQESAAERHRDEDREVSEYLRRSRAADRADQLLAALPNGWLLCGLAGLTPIFVQAAGTSAPLAVSLGGVLLAFQALSALRSSLQSLIQLGIGWQQVRPLWQGARHSSDRPPALSLGETAVSPDSAAANSPATDALLTVRGLSYRYRPGGRLVLRDTDLQIAVGDRLLLEGASGGGKSTLAALLAGLRRPESGVLLLHGYDRQTLGDAVWRQRIVAAPQFHENHIFNDTFAFNLLLGRSWPPSPTDLQEAAAVCAELGLDHLLARMPAGWQQMLGDSGWQLSHGERSRVFIARALLQRADLLIFDESFGALDPENLGRALDCVRRRAPTLLVIAHP